MNETSVAMMILIAMFVVAIGLVFMKFNNEEDAYVQEYDKRDDRNYQDMDDSEFDDWDSDDGVVGILPKPLSDSDTKGGESDSGRDDQIPRGVTSRSKQRRRAKRRR